MSDCSICVHPKRKEIDKALVAGSVSIRAIASQWHVGREALRRHVNNGHIGGKIQKAAAAKEKVEAEDLLVEIGEIEGTTKKIITEAMARKVKLKTEKGDAVEVQVPDHSTALKAIDTRGKQIELKGKIMGIFRNKIELSGKIKLPFSDMSDEEVKQLAREVLAESD